MRLRRTSNTATWHHQRTLPLDAQAIQVTNPYQASGRGLSNATWAIVVLRHPERTVNVNSSDLKDREPVAVNSAITNAIKTVVLSLLAVAVGFGWVHWTDAQTALVVSLVAAFFVLLSTVSRR